MFLPCRAFTILSNSYNAIPGNHKSRRCTYTDGDEEDLSLKDLRALVVAENKRVAERQKTKAKRRTTGKEGTESNLKNKHVACSKENVNNDKAKGFTSKKDVNIVTIGNKNKGDGERKNASPSWTKAKSQSESLSRSSKGKLQSRRLHGESEGELTSLPFTNDCRADHEINISSTSKKDSHSNMEKAMTRKRKLRCDAKQLTESNCGSNTNRPNKVKSTQSDVDDVDDVSYDSVTKSSLIVSAYGTQSADEKDTGSPKSKKIKILREKEIKSHDSLSDSTQLLENLGSDEEMNANNTKHATPASHEGVKRNIMISIDVNKDTSQTTINVSGDVDIVSNRKSMNDNNKIGTECKSKKTDGLDKSNNGLQTNIGTIGSKVVKMKSGLQRIKEGAQQTINIYKKFVLRNGSSNISNEPKSQKHTVPDISKTVIKDKINTDSPHMAKKQSRGDELRSKKVTQGQTNVVDFPNFNDIPAHVQKSELRKIMTQDDTAKKLRCVSNYTYEEINKAQDASNRDEEDHVIADEQSCICNDKTKVLCYDKSLGNPTHPKTINKHHQPNTNNKNGKKTKTTTSKLGATASRDIDEVIKPSHRAIAAESEHEGSKKKSVQITPQNSEETNKQLSHTELDKDDPMCQTLRQTSTDSNSGNEGVRKSSRQTEKENVEVIGEVGYCFTKLFPGYGLFNGMVVEIFGECN